MAGSNLDWLFHLIGAVLVAIGALWLVLALLRDRSRGRRRCPQCWYDMAGVPGLKCPECGRDSREERALFRTRRRWGWAAVAGLVLGAGMCAAAVPTWRLGWERLVPTTVLVFVAPAQDAGIRTGPPRPIVRGSIGMPGGLPPGSGVLTSPGGAPVLSRVPLLGRMFAPGPEPTVGERLADEFWRRLSERKVPGWLARRYVARYMRAAKIDVMSAMDLPGSWPVGERIAARVTRVPIGTGPASISVYARVAGGTEWLADGFTGFLDSVGHESEGVPLQIEVRSGLTVIHRADGVYPCGIHGDVSTFLDRAGGPGVDERVRAAMAPALRWLSDGTPVVRVGDRTAAAPWPGIDFGVAYTMELRRGDRVLARGHGKCEWTRPVWKDWEDVELAWEPGGAEEAAQGGLRLVFAGNPRAAGKMYVTSPWGRRAACWSGEFEVAVPDRTEHGPR